MSLENEEFVPMETTNALVPRHRPHEVHIPPIPPSTPSDSAMVMEAGGDPTHAVKTSGSGPEIFMNFSSWTPIWLKTREIVFLGEPPLETESYHRLWYEKQNIAPLFVVCCILSEHNFDLANRLSFV